MNIDQSVVLITGAAVRVGRAAALYLAGKGARIAFSYYREEEPWQDTLQEIKAQGVDAIAVQAEMQSADSIQNLIDRTEAEFGRIDVLINNASIWLSSPFNEISEEEWDLAFKVNLRGPFLASQKAARVMRKQGRGVIINITDLSAFQAWPTYAHHAASKAGLVSLTKTMAYELAPEIRVNAIAPGTVLLPDDCSEEKRRWAEEKSLLRRVGTPEDVARLIEFLIISDFASGSVYFIDGGRALV